jgi:YNFM family putative membrane transporter
LDWRYAFVSASLLTLVATLVALRGLPPGTRSTAAAASRVGYLSLVMRWDLLRIYLCATGSFAIFSSVFNFLPFRLAQPPFGYSTEVTTLLYLVYVIGIFIGPVAGKLSNRFGSGSTLLAGSLILLAALVLIRLPWVAAIIAGLIGLCAGFFTIHSAAVGALNRKLATGQGRANALYVLFYYAGGWLGITGSGFAYQQGGWAQLVDILMLLLVIPLMAGFSERRQP